MRKTFLFLLLVLLAIGCEAPTRGYLKCRDCKAAYKSMGGLPGQHNGMKCRACGGELFWTSKENSGWDEERYQRNGDELK